MEEISEHRILRGGLNGSPSILEHAAFAIGICIFFFGCYGIPNRLIPISACVDLTTYIDSRIPFIPEFVFPFYLAYLLVLMPATLIRRRSLLLQSALAFAALFVISCILFFVMPVYVPRPSRIPDSIAGALVKAIYSSDRPVCGFPSLHVSASLLAAIIVAREHRYVGLVSFFFFFLTSLSTLFIKQHVILDVLGGVCIALAVDWLVLRSGGLRIRRVFRAAILNIRNMTTRPAGGEHGRFTESRKSTNHGIEYDMYEPANAAAKTFLVVHGVTLKGERDPRLMNFSRSLAESGIRTAAIALPGLKACRFEEEDVSAIVNVVKELSYGPAAKVGIIAFSLGAGLALIAAAEPSASSIVDPLLLFGPYYSFPETWNLILQQSDNRPNNDREWDDHIWIRMVLAYRAIDSLDLNERDRQEFIDFFESYCFESSIQRKRQFYERVLKRLDNNRLGYRVIDNRAPENLSPQGKLSAIKARVLILHDEYDRLISPEQSRKIMSELHAQRAGGTQKLLVTPFLSHVTAKSAWKLFDIVRILAIMGEIFR